MFFIGKKLWRGSSQIAQTEDEHSEDLIDHETFEDLIQSHKKETENHLKKIEELNFYHEGHAKFNTVLAGHSNNITTLCSRFITELVDYIGALQGCVFLKQGESEDDSLTLKFSGGYNLPNKEYIHKSFTPGEGQVGTCFKERSFIEIDPLPKGYIHISSGLGKANPGYLLLFPVHSNNIIEGVIEISGFKKPDKYKIEFASSIIESFSSRITINKSNQENQKIVDRLHSQIKENKLAQERINKQSALLDALLNNVPDFIYFKDTESRFIRISKSMVKLFTGAKHTDDLIGKSDFDFQSPEDARKYFDEEKEIMKSGKSIINQIQHEEFENGVEQWVAVTKMPLTDSDGKVIGTFGISKDITETKKLELEAQTQNQELQAQEEELRQNLEEMQAIQEEMQKQVEQNKTIQQELKQQNSLLDALLDNIPDFIYFKDKQSQFIRISKSMVKLFAGAKRTDDLIGKSDFDFQSPEDARKYFKEEKEIMKSGKSIINQIQHEVFENGVEQWVAVTKMPLTDSDGKVIGTFGISKDITETKKLELEAQNQNQELQAQEEELRQNLEEMQAIQEEMEKQVKENKTIQQELKQQGLLLGALLKYLPDYIYFKDRKSRFIRVSNSMLRLFKNAKSPEEMVGKTDFDFQDKKAARKYFNDEQEIIKTGKPIVEDIQHEIFESGVDQWVTTTKMPLTDEEGKIIGTFGISKNISDLNNKLPELFNGN